VQLDFPDNPEINDIYSSNGVSWYWNGTVWRRSAAQLGDLYPKGGGDDKVFLEHSYTITEDYEITSGHHAITAGPLEIEEGVTITVSDGSNWLVL
jgi:hypothetical protein